MCGRYFVDEEHIEMKKIIGYLDKKYEELNIRKKEVFPTDVAPVIIYDKETDGIGVKPYQFGFPNPYKKGVLINARTETVLEKPTFKESVLSRRCILPSTGYYEWDGAGYKYLIQNRNSDMVYMAGIYRVYEGRERFVILTTQANRSVRDVHHRMPLVLQEDEIIDWIKKDEHTEKILRQIPNMLRYSEVG